MSEDYSSQHDDEQRERQTAHEEAGASADFALGLAPGSAHELPPSALGNPALQRKVNSPVRVATIQRMQQQYGNRATQRFLQRLTSTPVQRAEGEEGVLDEELKLPIQSMRAGKVPLSVQREDPPAGGATAPATPSTNGASPSAAVADAGAPAGAP